MQFMITNGGPHPADKWADVTTDTILNLIDVKEDSVSEAALDARAAKRDLRPVLFDIFNGHHEGVQARERSALPSIKKHHEATAHCARPLELHEDVPAALQEVNAVLKTSPFAAHFAKPEVQEVLQNIIGQHSANVVHIERRWHADRLAKKES
jgi:hypothetical protein